MDGGRDSSCLAHCNSPAPRNQGAPDWASISIVVGMCVKNQSTQIRCHGRAKIEVAMATFLLTSASRRPQIAMQC